MRVLRLIAMVAEVQQIRFAVLTEPHAAPHSVSPFLRRSREQLISHLSKAR